ncbi:ABC transporter ATP-binding protein [Microbacterium trichothecenolyticum]|uniref:dipeptide ABC transporter ATP-binding protein n=1 Tax=Microbacterium trichothecenolyticum TaxID=69370 RepID=UPI001C6E4743|nr:ABC transporter ATP-binding protein [Microbacterium trichothecenolyticum]MBW9121936.1 ABC transporter ATP-binding protein [Microbacterium trichothecenolyticum]
MSAVLELDGFTVAVDTPHGRLVLADGIDLSVEAGETLCVVGESGSGKSVTMLSAVRLLDFTAPIVLSGRALIGGADVVGLDQAAMTAIRGRRVGVIFQEAMEALNPSQRIGDQLDEAFRASGVADRSSERPGGARSQLVQAHDKALALLAEVGIVDPPTVLRKYPHELSGGMQQRVMIAMALMGDPELLIADEPTTALDVTVQADIIRLLRRLQRERGMAIVLITHDMGIAAEIADRIAVLYAGQVVETGPADQMLHRPQHPYTKALLECVPRPGERLEGRMRTIPGSVPSPGEAPAGDRFAPRNALATERCATEPPPLRVSADGTHSVRSWDPIREWTPELVARLTGATGDAAPQRALPSTESHLVLRGVSKTYGARDRLWFAPRATGTRAVIDVDLEIRRGELFGIVGESGSGKSTLGRIMLDLERPDAGSVVELDGVLHDSRRRRRDQRALRREIQAIFQDPQGSIDPRQTIREAIAEPLKELTTLDRRGIETRVREMLDAVGLPAAAAGKHASQLSGGQRQRVAIARALGPRPRLIVADEPTSALDVSVQGQIVNLLLDLQREFGLTLVMVTHNLSLITAIADRVGVMYRGRLVEVGDAERVVSAPQDEYTRRLLAANPDPFHPRTPSAV